MHYAVLFYYYRSSFFLFSSFSLRRSFFSANVLSIFRRRFTKKREQREPQNARERWPCARFLPPAIHLRGEFVRVCACVCMSVRIKLNTTCNFIYSKLNGGKHAQGGGGRDRGKCRNAFSFSFECEIIFSFFCF